MKQAFDLQKFREEFKQEYRIIQEMQDEFVEIAKAEISKISSFKGYGATEKYGLGPIRYSFTTTIKVANVSVKVSFDLQRIESFQGFSGYKVEKTLLWCDELHIDKYRIDPIENLKKFKIFFPTKRGWRKQTVIA